MYNNTVTVYNTSVVTTNYITNNFKIILDITRFPRTIHNKKVSRLKYLLFTTYLYINSS